MPKIQPIDGRLQTIVPLQVKPFEHKEVPTVIGSAISKEAGTVLYGYYSMDYLLPGGDRLRLFANHNKHTLQLLLLTHSPEKINQLPGKRPSSLVADTIEQLNRYCIRSASYARPRTVAQLNKYKLADDCIKKLQILLDQERKLTADDWAGQERLRRRLINLLEKCRDNNRLLAINPVISEGKLGQILYDCSKAAEHYEFNRVHPVSRIDQLDFSTHKPNKRGKRPCFVWDSELHIGDNEQALSDSLRVICKIYNLNPQGLSTVPANRFKRMEEFLSKLWRDGQAWINYLAAPKKPSQASHTNKKENGLAITQIAPYYHLQGLNQVGYPTLDDLIANLTDTTFPALTATSRVKGMHLLSSAANGSWVKLPGQRLILRLHNEMTLIRYFKSRDSYFPLPSGKDLFSLSQLSKEHLFLPERAKLQLKAFFSRVPTFFSYSYTNLKRFIIHELHDEFMKHVHSNHQQEPIIETIAPQRERRTKFKRYSSLQKILKNKGILANGQSLEQFVKVQLAGSPYVIAREQHSPSPPAYTNPFHRMLGIVRHIAAFFVDTSEKNPILGSLAMAAYAYGAGAIIAPTVLTTILSKLHLKGLIYGIKPTQILGQWMSHGKASEAISAATTYWQAIVVGGDLDKFFVQAVEALRDDPAEIAIVVALAIGLGYGLCKTIPMLQEEMGKFPYINYAALGAKGGAAIFDTIMYPGDDWLLGSIKWLLKGGLILGKFFLGPFVEAYHYGFKKGFLSGALKSGLLVLQTIKQSLAAGLDFLLAIGTIPLLEVSSMLLHVPFRGITNLMSNCFSLLSNWRPVGQSLISVAIRPTGWNYFSGFHPSPLYGFYNPLNHYSDKIIINVVLNIAACCVLPPWQLVKNLALLPVIDLLSFSVRLSLAIINPISRLVIYIAGKLLTTSAPVWSNSLGLPFKGAARTTTLSANAIDYLARQVKQTLLAQIQILRRKIFDWGFGAEDATIHRINNDRDYFLANPMRLEQLPRDSTRSLLKTLLNEQSSPRLDQPSHSTLFAGDKRSGRKKSLLTKEVVFAANEPEIIDSNQGLVLST